MSDQPPPTKVVRSFVKEFDEKSYQDALDRLHGDYERQEQEAEAWAKEIYDTLRVDPSDERAKSLNADRKTCLNLLYDMVRTWKEDYDSSPAFEDAIANVFKSRRLVRILSLALPMDRAQALYKMRHGSNKSYGLPWFCKMHLEPDTVYAREFPDEHREWAERIGPSFTQDATFIPPMNNKLFRLLFSEKLNLRSNASFGRWARPMQLADIGSSFKAVESSDTSAAAAVQQFANRYREEEYEEALGRLADDRGSQGHEEWAEELYKTLRDNPENERAKQLNADRKTCLNLLYDLVIEWEDFEFSAEFEAAIDTVFKKYRLVQILLLCLPMDRAQALCRMRHGSNRHYGMPWFSKLHLEPDTAYAREFPEEQQEWIKLTASYMQDGSFTPPMNRKLFRLLFSDRLLLRNNEHLAKWARPTMVQQETLPSTATSTTASTSLATSDIALQTVVQEFVDRYSEESYQEALRRLDNSRGTRETEEWAKEIYLVLRHDDERSTMLNADRKTCLKLISDLVRKWEEHGYSAEFEEAIANVFRIHRLVRVLSICLPMDRAQALYHMKRAGSTSHGMPWFSKYHLVPDTAYAREFPDEHEEWIAFSAALMAEDATFFPPMSGKLFRLLFSDRLNLRSNELLARLSRPAKVEPQEESTPAASAPTEEEPDLVVLATQSFESQGSEFTMGNDDLPPGMEPGDSRLFLAPPSPNRGVSGESAFSGVEVGDMADAFIEMNTREEEVGPVASPPIRQDAKRFLGVTATAPVEKKEESINLGEGVQIINGIQVLPPKKRSGFGKR